MKPNQMSPMDRLRWAIAPDARRSMSLLLGGSLAFIMLGVMATFFEVPRVLGGPIILAMFLAWVVAFCGVVGYLRWLFSAAANEHITKSTDRQL
jgi:hypothetical protein